jgi:hypothetical protein
MNIQQNIVTIHPGGAIVNSKCLRDYHNSSELVGWLSAETMEGKGNFQILTVMNKQATS